MSKKRQIFLKTTCYAVCLLVVSPALNFAKRLQTKILIQPMTEILPGNHLMQEGSQSWEVKRAKLTLSGTTSKTNFLKYSFAIDAAKTSLLRKAEIDFLWNRIFSTNLGYFKIPFSPEVSKSSSKKLLIERGKVNSYLSAELGETHFSGALFSANILKNGKASLGIFNPPNIAVAGWEPFGFIQGQVQWNPKQGFFGSASTISEVIKLAEDKRHRIWLQDYSLGWKNKAFKVETEYFLGDNEAATDFPLLKQSPDFLTSSLRTLFSYQHAIQKMKTGPVVQWERIEDRKKFSDDYTFGWVLNMPNWTLHLDGTVNFEEQLETTSFKRVAVLLSVGEQFTLFKNKKKRHQ